MRRWNGQVLNSPAVNEGERGRIFPYIHTLCVCVFTYHIQPNVVYFRIPIYCARMGMLFVFKLHFITNIEEHQGLEVCV